MQNISEASGCSQELLSMPPSQRRPIGLPANSSDTYVGRLDRQYWSPHEVHQIYVRISLFPYGRIYKHLWNAHGRDIVRGQNAQEVFEFNLTAALFQLVHGKARRVPCIPRPVLQTQGSCNMGPLVCKGREICMCMRTHA